MGRILDISFCFSRNFFFFLGILQRANNQHPHKQNQKLEQSGGAAGKLAEEETQPESGSHTAVTVTEHFNTSDY